MISTHRPTTSQPNTHQHTHTRESTPYDTCRCVSTRHACSYLSPLLSLCWCVRLFAFSLFVSFLLSSSPQLRSDSKQPKTKGKGKQNKKRKEGKQQKEKGKERRNKGQKEEGRAREAEGGRRNKARRGFRSYRSLWSVSLSICPFSLSSIPPLSVFLFSFFFSLFFCLCLVGLLLVGGAESR